MMTIIAMTTMIFGVRAHKDGHLPQLKAASHSQASKISVVKQTATKEALYGIVHMEPRCFYSDVSVKCAV